MRYRLIDNVIGRPDGQFSKCIMPLNYSYQVFDLESSKNYTVFLKAQVSHSGFADNQKKQKKGLVGVK